MRAAAPCKNDMTHPGPVGWNADCREGVSQSRVKSVVPLSIICASIQRLNRRRCLHRGRHIDSYLPLAPPPAPGNGTLIGRRGRPSAELSRSEVKLSTAAAGVR